MALTLRKTEGPARWCYPSANAFNLIQRDPKLREQLGQCVSIIEPVSGFEDFGPDAYIRRFYRADIDDRFCEVTLSTVRGNDRIVGSDCFYGLFDQEDDTGVGMTADEFG